jgi:hypothetical protein
MSTASEHREKLFELLCDLLQHAVKFASMQEEPGVKEKLEQAGELLDKAEEMLEEGDGLEERFRDIWGDFD